MAHIHLRRREITDTIDDISHWRGADTLPRELLHVPRLAYISLQCAAHERDIYTESHQRSSSSRPGFIFNDRARVCAYICVCDLSPHVGLKLLQNSPLSQPSLRLSLDTISRAASETEERAYKFRRRAACTLKYIYIDSVYIYILYARDRVTIIRGMAVCLCVYRGGVWKMLFIVIVQAGGGKKSRGLTLSTARGVDKRADLCCDRVNLHIHTRRNDNRLRSMRAM